MFYIAKLARRLARLRQTSAPCMLLALLFSAACSAGEPTSTSSDNPAEPDAPIVISPRAVTIERDQQVRFTAYEVSGSAEVAAIEWTATGGTIGLDGSYSASDLGDFRVIGKRRGHGRSRPDTSVVVVVPWQPAVVAVAVSPEAGSIAATGKLQFSAVGKLSDGSTVAIGATWAATGGSIDAGGMYTAGSTPGSYRVVGTHPTTGHSDTAAVAVSSPPPAPPPTVDGIVLTPASSSIQTGGTQQFAASGRMSDGSTAPVNVTYTAAGGSITTGGFYTAGTTAGTYRVIASTSGLADTSTVTVSAPTSPPPPPPPPTLASVVLTPASASIQTAGTQQFAASGRMSDGSTASVNVTYVATGGSITSGGLYTAGTTAGSYRVIASASGLADTSTVSVSAPPPPPPPPPPTGRTFFLADAESGTLSPWSDQIATSGALAPASVSTRARNGSRSFRYEVTTPTGDPNFSLTRSFGPQSSMGGPSGNYLSGYWSAWIYIDAGFTGDDWRMLLGWQTEAGGGFGPSPISHIELRNWPRPNGPLQLAYVLKNCSVGLYSCPNIPGYENAGGYYFQTAQSPAGIKSFPRQQWVHVVFYYKMAPTNGQVTIWQDGVKIMDLTAPTMNTFGGHSNGLINPAGDMLFQFGMYEGPKTDGVQRMYADDVRVTDYRPVP